MNRGTEKLGIKEKTGIKDTDVYNLGDYKHVMACIIGIYGWLRT